MDSGGVVFTSTPLPSGPVVGRVGRWLVFGAGNYVPERPVTPSPPKLSAIDQP